MDFMNLPGEYRKKDSYFQILPIEYEGEVTYGKGTLKGPEKIIEASVHLEYYDEQFDVEPFEKGIYTLSRLDLKGKKPEEVIKDISNESEKQKNSFLISLGGDHSVTIGTIRGLEKNQDFDVIILDAHTDFFHSWNNSQFNHRCTAQRIIEKHKILEIGIRSMDIDEKKLIKNNEDISIIKAYEYNDGKLIKEIKKLKKNIYISIDVDVFDPSFIRNTGTPEPGGFFWNDMIKILEIIFKGKNIIGADIVEFAPNYNFEAEAFSLAKLCHKLMALKYHNEKILLTQNKL